MASIPSLITATPAEGQQLALKLADGLLASLPTPTTAAAHLQSGAAAPSREVVAAIYFHAVMLANHGWTSRS
jgi:hypothetical protein